MSWGKTEGCRVGGRRRAGRGCGLVALVVATLVLASAASPAGAQSGPAPFGTRGMWIWVVGAANHGNAGSISATARRYGISTLYVKSGDGSQRWGQFNPALVQALHAAGLRVCAWQYVYGNHPIAEAFVGAAAVHAGADCLVIDAESEYQGKYVQAQRYLAWLRKLIGANFPVALAGLPYVDYHPGFPYSVFLGPGGAQFNMPQMYWRDIGTTVGAVYAHTYAYNRLYARPIEPLGQVFQNPPAWQIVRFREAQISYGASGVSWWDWQDASRRSWSALSRPIGTAPYFLPSEAVAVLKRKSAGDLVVWAQLHLLSAGYQIAIDGGFGPKTQAAVKSFQLAHGLTVDGIIGPETWQALLAYPPAPVIWTRSGARATAPSTGSSSASAAGGPTVVTVPKSATLPAKGNEIPPSLGAGYPR